MGAKSSRRAGKSQRRFAGTAAAGWFYKRKEAGHYSGLNENKCSKNFDVYRSLGLHTVNCVSRPTTELD
jgi:hypothetical protein